MLLAMASDVRVILIKLADRLHNMRTLGYMTPAKKRRIAGETMEVYVPIAHRLGLNNIYRELQDLSFSHLYPVRYQTLAKAVKAARGNRREVVKKILEAVKNHAGEAGGLKAEVLRPRKDPVRHLQKDAQQAPVVLAGARRLRFPRRGRQRRPTVTWRWAPCTRCTSRCRASSRTTSPSASSTATSRCTPR